MEAALSDCRARNRLNLVPGGPTVAPPFLGTSPTVRQLLAQADQLARTDLPVLLVGESGTGKEVLALRLHRHGARAGGPFVAENCAAVPESLAESEFFGHVRGAFTGADCPREGAFARADGGTLLLDEIGDMPLALQAKLLRVLESGRVRPVGASHEIRVDVRILCATHRDLELLVREGRFRQDLYYRLCGATLRLPALEEHPEDIEELARHFLEQLNGEHGTRKHFAHGVIELLELRPWPGNVRELRHCIAASYHLCDGERIDLSETLAPAAAVRPRGEGLVNAVASLAEIERDAIVLALRAADGDVREAARLLGISRSGIYEKLRRYGLDRRKLRLLAGSVSRGVELTCQAASG